MKPRARKHANYVCFHKLILATSNMAERAKQYVHFRCWQALVPTQKEKTICALVERIYLIIVSRERNHGWLELLRKIFEPFNVMGCVPPVCLWACKERYNLCMNCVSLDGESLDRVSWTSTTLQSCYVCYTTVYLCYCFVFAKPNLPTMFGRLMSYLDFL